MIPYFLLRAVAAGREGGRDAGMQGCRDAWMHGELEETSTESEGMISSYKRGMW
jgi:hypothetical protein